MSAFDFAPALALQGQRSAAKAPWELTSTWSLADPWFLLLWVAVPVVLFLGLRRSRQGALSAPSTLADPLPSLGQRMAWVVPVASALSLAVGIFALARPLTGDQRFKSESEGVDIALVLDRSTSMEERMGGPNSGTPRRFDVARKVVADFAKRRMTDREGAADQVALFGFARFTELLCPFTTDVDAILGVIQDLGMEMRQDMDSTAIGVAIAKAVEVLGHSEAESRIIVLLTDGEERTRHVMEPRAAAAMADAQGIRVYTVFVGPRALLLRSQFGVEEIRPNVDELRQVARLTGGRFFHAEDETQLEEAYASIEELERTPREDSRYAEHYERYRPFVFASLLLAALACLGRHTWARRLPC